MRRKEYAASLGLANTGRGRMSREALDAIEKARSEGMVFDDDAPVPVKRDKPAPAPRVSVKREPVSTSANVMGDTVFVYPLTQTFKGTDSNGKTQTVNARAICRNSGYSIAGCSCGNHRALVPSTMEVIDVR